MSWTAWLIIILHSFYFIPLRFFIIITLSQRTLCLKGHFASCLKSSTIIIPSSTLSKSTFILIIYDYDCENYSFFHKNQNWVNRCQFRVVSSNKRIIIHQNRCVVWFRGYETCNWVSHSKATHLYIFHNLLNSFSFRTYTKLKSTPRVDVWAGSRGLVWVLSLRTTIWCLFLKFWIFVYTTQLIVHSLDYLNDVLHEEHEGDEEIQKEGSPNNEEWDSGLTFTAKSSRKCFEWLFL